MRFETGIHRHGQGRGLKQGKEEGLKEGMKLGEEKGMAKAFGGMQETVQKIKQFLSEHPKSTPAEAVERFAQTEEMAKTLLLIYSE